MKLKNALFIGILSWFCAKAQSLQGSFLANDEQAFNYCLQTKNTYIVIVWPLGFYQLRYITQTLNSYASVKYIKSLTLNKKEMFSLYRRLHTMSYKTAKKYFKPYTNAISTEPWQLAVLILQTDAPLETILGWKKEIRDHIGASYYSIHINDYPEEDTITAAHAVFKYTPEVLV